jgi:serine/threonine protein kinase
VADLLDAVETHVDGDRRVLIKRLRDPEDEESIAAFFDECKVLLQLSHPNIVKLLDVGVAESRPFQVFELVEGEDLAGILASAKRASAELEPELALYITAEVAKGLEHAHNLAGMGIVHRDVTPENILISKSGAVTLADFGIAVFAQRSASTQVGLAKGKLAYMAPEQMLASHVDWRSDIFSLGCVLHALLLGESPLEDQDQVDRIFMGERIVLESSISASIQAILQRALAPNRRDRFDSAHEMVVACVGAMGPVDEEAAKRKLMCLIDALDVDQTPTIVQGPVEHFELDLESTAGEIKTFATRTMTVTQETATLSSGTRTQAPTPSDVDQFTEETTESPAGLTKREPRDPQRRARRTPSQRWFIPIVAFIVVSLLSLAVYVASVPRESAPAVAAPTERPLIAIPGKQGETEVPAKRPELQTTPVRLEKRRKPARRTRRPRSPAEKPTPTKLLETALAELEASKGVMPRQTLRRFERDYLELGVAANRVDSEQGRDRLVKEVSQLIRQIRKARAEPAASP